MRSGECLGSNSGTEKAQLPTAVNGVEKAPGLVAALRRNNKVDSARVFGREGLLHGQLVQHAASCSGSGVEEVMVRLALELISSACEGWGATCLHGPSARAPSPLLAAQPDFLSTQNSPVRDLYRGRRARAHAACHPKSRISGTLFPDFGTMNLARGCVFLKPERK